MSEETVGEIEEVEQTEDDYSEPTPNNSEESSEEDDIEDDIVSEEEEKDWKAEAIKAQEVADNYKKENEKYRKEKKENRVKDISVNKKEDEYEDYSDNTTFLHNDFLSKQSNVLAKFEDKINSLPEESWSKIQNKVVGTFNGVYTNATKNGNPVAEYALEKELNDLITWSESNSNHQVEIEKARAEGALSRKKLKSAEISSKSVKTPKSNIVITAEDKEKSDTSGIPAEQIAKIRLRKESISNNFNSLYER